MTFIISTPAGKTIAAERVLSYEWSRDISAACDGIRLYFLYDEPLSEAETLTVYYGSQAVLFGYVDYQSQTEDKVFLYARSSACLLVDNEAAQRTYQSPCVRALYLMNAQPLGFQSKLKNYYTQADYTVSRGTSCYGAINDFVRAFSDKPVRINPEGELYIPAGDVAYTVDENAVLSTKHIFHRGNAVSRIDYKTDGEYIHHRKSRYLEEQGICRARQLNLSAMPDWQRENILSNRLAAAAQDYQSAVITVAGVVTAELFSPIVYRDYDGYYITALNTVLDSKGERTQISLSKRLALREVDYVD